MSVADLTGWSRRLAPGGVILTPPGTRAGLIRIHDREPQRSLVALIETLRAGTPAGAELTLTESPHPLTTVEGEHAAFLECRSQRGNQIMQRSVGVVIGDDHFTVIDGRVEDPALFHRFHELTFDLTESYCLGLGANRWRRFFYQAPRGWQGLTRVKSEAWIALEFPRNRGMITAFHARPLEPNAAAAQHRVLYENLTSDARRTTGPQPCPPSLSGMPGQMAEFVLGAQARNDLVINRAYEDDRFVYLFRLQTDAGHADENRKVFDEVTASVQPIPRIRARAEAMVSHWFDD